MIAAKPELWEAICAREGGRFVMLGTPNRGSHATVEMLLGTATTIQQLALLDITRRAAEITAIMAGFPGVLELLPREDGFFPRRRRRTGALAGAVPADCSARGQSMDALAPDDPQARGASTSRAPAAHRADSGVRGRSCSGDQRGRRSSRINPAASRGRDRHGRGARRPGHQPAFPRSSTCSIAAPRRGWPQPLSAARGGAATYRTVPSRCSIPRRPP
jgi:hypothetical protein